MYAEAGQEVREGDRGHGRPGRHAGGPRRGKRLSGVIPQRRGEMRPSQSPRGWTSTSAKDAAAAPQRTTRPSPPMSYPPGYL